MKNGWIKIYRKIQENALWKKGRFSWGHAWIDLLLLATHKDTKLIVGDKNYDVSKGSLVISQRKLAKKWKWGIARVNFFLNYLQKTEQSIIYKTEHNFTHIFIKNYEQYQETEHKTERKTEHKTEHERNTSGTRAETKQEGKEEKKKETPLPPKGDLWKSEFEEARKMYPGTKRGLNTEFGNFKKKHKDWKSAIPLLVPAIKNQIEIKRKLLAQNRFVPEWKHFRTWINQRCWEEEIPKPKDEIDDIPDAEE